MGKLGPVVICGLALFLGLTVGSSPVRAETPFALLKGAGKAGSKLGSASEWIAAAETAVEVVKLVETLSRSDSPVTAKARLRATFADQKLQVSKTTLDVTMERISTNWRGKVQVELDVPCEVTYAIDLSRITPEHLRLEAGKRVLYVKMPPVHVETVAPNIEKMTFKYTFGWGRSRYVDVNMVSGLEADLRTACRAEARSRAEQELDSVRKTGQAALQDFLRKMFKAAHADLEVIVE